MNRVETATTENPAPGDPQPPTNGGATARSVPAIQPPPISMLRAMFYAPFRPAWVGEGTTNLSLKRAWLIHFMSALTTIAVILLAVQWAERSSLGPDPIAAILREVQREIGFLVAELNRYPLESTLAVLGIIALVEGMHLLIALVLMPWGARDEPLRKSFGFAVRQTWLASARLVIAAVIIGGPLAWMEHEDRRWRTDNPRPMWHLIAQPQRPTLPQSAPGYDKAMADYAVARGEWEASNKPYFLALRERQAKRPWILRHREAIGIPLGFLSALWFIWALLRSIGATRNVPPITRDRRCIECGYNLHTIPMESRCPECGKHVVESLGPDVHPGTAWDHRKPGDTLRAWWRCAIDVARTPKTFGRTLRVSDPGIAHRRFFGIALIAIWLVGVGAILTMFNLFTRPGELELWLLIPLAVGSLCSAGALAIACAGAMLVGLSQSLTDKRNLLPTAMQVASYLSGFLVLWAVVGAILVLTLVWMDKSFTLTAMASTIGLQSDILGSLFFCIPNFAFGMFFLDRLTGGTSATRYANK